MSTKDVDGVARILMQSWEKAEGEPVNPSYVATFADMARDILDTEWVDEDPTTTSGESIRLPVERCDGWGSMEHPRHIWDWREPRYVRFCKGEGV